MNLKYKLKGYIASEGETISSIASKLGITQPTLSQKINNESLRFTDVEKIASLLGYEIVWKKKD